MTDLSSLVDVLIRPHGPTERYTAHSAARTIEDLAAALFCAQAIVAEFAPGGRDALFFSSHHQAIESARAWAAKPSRLEPSDSQATKD